MFYETSIFNTFLFDFVNTKGSDNENKSDEMSDQNDFDDDDEDEEDRWEKEQIRKGVQITQVGKHLI